MPLVVRQIVIRSEVGGGPPLPDAERLGPGERAELKEEILAACRSWLLEHLRQEKER